jgi:CheY-like chemotaxis protein/phosphoribosyl 1,2-cyclic phosphodiesterase
MLVRFWGTRGSIATPGPNTNRYGGNTSCVEIVTNSGKHLICDCGTGARALGAFLVGSAPGRLEATILLSHTHWDHIQGFPFFAPLFIPGNRITVCGPRGAHASLPEVLAGQMEYTYFPVELQQLGADIRYRDLSEGVNEVGGIRVTAQFLNHPAAALGYRIEADGVSVLYLCDHEPYWEPLWRSDVPPGSLEAILHDGDRRHAAFMQNADLVIHDSQYTPEEYPAKKNWGHSTYAYVVQIAAAANVRKLFLTHHDPTHNDDFLDAMEAKAQQLAISLNSPLQIACAREGLEQAVVKLPGHLLKVNEVATSDQGGEALVVLVIDDDEDLRVLARTSLRRAGHHVLEASGGEQAFAVLLLEKPDLILLDLTMPAPDGFAVLERLRAEPATRDIPVIVLTAHGDEESARRSFELGATDFLAKPFTPPQLDARVRSCVARADRSDAQATVPT